MKGEDNPPVSTLKSAINVANSTSDAASRRPSGTARARGQRKCDRCDKSREGQKLGPIRPADDGEIAERQHDAEPALDALCPDEMAPGDSVAVGQFFVLRQRFAPRPDRPQSSCSHDVRRGLTKPQRVRLREPDSGGKGPLVLTFR